MFIKAGKQLLSADSRKPRIIIDRLCLFDLITHIPASKPHKAFLMYLKI